MDLEVCKEYNAAVAEFNSYCATEANLNVSIHTDCYPMQVHLTPSETQQTMFDNDEEADVPSGSIIINIGIKPKFKSSLKFQMDAALLKKLIKKATNLGALYLHAFRESSAEIGRASCRERV